MRSFVSTIYFIKPKGKKGPIKIGCTKTPVKRLETLSCWSPIPLEIMCTLPGSFELERKIQNFFGHAHSHREWFKPVSALADAIYRLKAGEPIEQVIDLSGRMPSIHRAALRKRFTPLMRLRLRLSAAVTRIENTTKTRAPEAVRAVLYDWQQRSFDRCLTISAAERALVEAFILCHRPNSLPPRDLFPSQLTPPEPLAS